ncbi:glycosyltransferase [Cellulomonas sp. ATA003]|uniref:glycosyltransferase n=1 Tax=Cellulomonas sp. ATA003 TaxID=3073064 RepID=UPI002872CA4D|nr:glycosyltransferase [Cellulomonas sp. ATA003]WNB85184.1 glycosyltransferase [Cellulomonas sp. ATA003]
MRAAADLQARGVPVRLRIVGAGAERPGLEHLAASLRAPVDFLGPVPHAEVVHHYGWADTLLVSLRGWGPFEWTVPSKLYEVLATGRHITAALAGEGAGLVSRTGAGDVVTPEDARALVDLWTTLQRDRTRLVVDGRGRAWATEHADFDVLAERYLAVLHDVVGHGTGGRSSPRAPNGEP